MTDVRKTDAGVSPNDPLVIIAGIRQFGLAPDGSDLRDLEAAILRSAPVPQCEAEPVAWRWRSIFNKGHWIYSGTKQEPHEQYIIEPLYAAPARCDAGSVDALEYVTKLERIAEIVRDDTRLTADGTIHNSTDVAKLILTAIPHLPVKDEAVREPTAYELLAWFKKRPGISWEATIRDIERAISGLLSEQPRR